MVVASLGSIRNIEWLEGAGLAAGFWGVACDAGCRAFDINGVVTDNIFVAGRHRARPPRAVRVPVSLAGALGQRGLGAAVAAHNMVSLEPDRRPHLPLPAFWSGQFGVNIKGVGVRSFGDEIVFTQGSVKERPLRRRLRPPGPHRRRGHIRSRQVAGVLRGNDRAVGAVPAPARGLRRPADTKPVPAEFPDPRAPTAFPTSS